MSAHGVWSSHGTGLYTKTINRKIHTASLGVSGVLYDNPRSIIPQPPLVGDEDLVRFVFNPVFFIHRRIAR